jgi:hypothetical protein
MLESTAIPSCTYGGITDALGRYRAYGHRHAVIRYDRRHTRATVAAPNSAAPAMPFTSAKVIECVVSDDQRAQLIDDITEAHGQGRGEGMRDLTWVLIAQRWYRLVAALQPRLCTIAMSSRTAQHKRRAAEAAAPDRRQ